MLFSILPNGKILYLGHILKIKTYPKHDEIVVRGSGPWFKYQVVHDMHYNSMNPLRLVTPD